MTDMLSFGSPLWLGIFGVMLIVVILLFVFRSRRVFGAGGSERFDVTEIPADVDGAREFIVRDDKTGSQLQFIALMGHARIVKVRVPPRHEGTGVEVELFQVALDTSAMFATGIPDSWTWPPVDPSAGSAIMAFARSRPELALYDSSGNRY